MRFDRRSVQHFLLALAIGSLAGAIALAFTGEWPTAATALAISSLIVVTIPRESGPPYSLSLAAAVAAPLVLLNEADNLDHSNAAVALVVGILGAHAYRAVVGPTPAGFGFVILRSLTGAMLFLQAFAISFEQSVSAGRTNLVDSLTFSISLAVFVWFIADVALGAAIKRVTTGQLFTNGVSIAISGWQIAVSILATGVLFGIAWRFTEWWWAVLVAVLPFGFAHIAFHRAHETRTTYRQTMRALSRIPEVAGLSPDGHGDRTARLSLEVATELYLTPREVADLEFAAQMHDIGRITLNQPSVLRMGFTDDDIARWGSEMVAEVPYLKDVSGLVLAQHEPYRRPGKQKDLELAMGSKIIKAVSAYDHATTELGFLPIEALEVLHRGAAYDYDPDVIRAIRTVLERQQAI